MMSNTNREEKTLKAYMISKIKHVWHACNNCSLLCKNMVVLLYATINHSL